MEAWKRNVAQVITWIEVRHIVIQVLNHSLVIPEILYRESNGRPSTQALEGDDWVIETIVLI